ncbi:MAG TPA: GNAT family N-acetyltransferase [Thioploca sp.]|nr:GNAT family N-acetyltransferase [Thioploca sp.]
MQIHLAKTDEEIERCFPVMVQLRPHVKPSNFLPTVKSQMQNGYRLAFVESEGKILSVAGFRVGCNLAWGKHLYVDDLISDEYHRSMGAGKKLFGWLIEYAQAQSCQQLHLDSGIQRFQAHKFYLREGMKIASHHFFTDL